MLGGEKQQAIALMGTGADPVLPLPDYEIERRRDGISRPAPWPPSPYAYCYIHEKALSCRSLHGVRTVFNQDCIMKERCYLPRFDNEKSVASLCRPLD